MLSVILSLIAGLAFCISTGITEGAQLRENKLILSDMEELRLNALWHTSQTVERITAICFGFMISFVFQTGVILAVSVTLVIHSSYWIIYNSFVNVYLNRHIFHQTKTSTSTIDNLFNRLGLPMIVVQVLYYIGALSFLWTQLP